jgi:hypothetical protein
MFGFFSFMKSVLSEDGQGSYSRTAAMAIVLASIGWVSHVVWKTHALPDLTGVSAFVCSTVGFHYGVNKASDIIGAIKGTTPNPNPSAVTPPNPTP